MSVAISESRPAGRGRFASALASRDLRTLILAFIVDGSSSWAYTIVLTAYVFGLDQVFERVIFRLL